MTLLWHYYYTYDIYKSPTIMTHYDKSLHILNYYHTYDIEGTIIAYYDKSKTLCTLYPLWHYYIHYNISNYYYTYDIEALLFAIMTITKHYAH